MGKFKLWNLLKIVSLFNKLKLGLPIILKFTDSSAVIVKIPANKLGILQIVIKNPVTKPASIPATIAITVARTGLTPL